MDWAEICGGVREKLLAMREAETGVWTGCLASSALGTALAAVALADGDVPDDRARALAGAGWLAAHANGDGGWGDTPESPSNLSTTLLATAALRRLSRECRGAVPAAWSEAVRRGDAWASARTGTLSAADVAHALHRIYGADRTFAVPILAFLALCGSDEAAWKRVPSLPFALALLPRGVYRFLRLQVVSYALPALIAVGLCRHVCAARARGGWAWGRRLAGPLLRRLAALQPDHGGFLDAIPLTAFVCLTLRRAGYAEHPVVRRGADFLRRSARPDGSWAIDSNLRTWVTSLAVRSVCAASPGGRWDGPEAERVAAWLVRTQHRAVHPFTGARPGGWAWTDLPGGVPDADDTAGALLALKSLERAGCRIDLSDAVRGGVKWLVDLQNADGGLPTFCRGWGRLPFDRSCPDISAHALSALAAWGGRETADPAVRRTEARLLRFLLRSQAADGSWTPLWFGCPEAADGANPVVGTARVVDALRTVRFGTTRRGAGDAKTALRRGEAWLAARQRGDGGWGMGAVPTVEETAWAVIALAGGGAEYRAAAERGGAWLAARCEAGGLRAAPIGLYFALLWYHEGLYPWVWTLEAFAKLANVEKGNDYGE